MHKSTSGSLSRIIRRSLSLHLIYLTVILIAPAPLHAMWIVTMQVNDEIDGTVLAKATLHVRAGQSLELWGLKYVKVLSGWSGSSVPLTHVVTANRAREFGYLENVFPYHEDEMPRIHIVSTPVGNKYGDYIEVRGYMGRLGHQQRWADAWFSTEYRPYYSGMRNYTVHAKFGRLDWPAGWGVQRRGQGIREGGWPKGRMLCHQSPTREPPWPNRWGKEEISECWPLSRVHGITIPQGVGRAKYTHAMAKGTIEFIRKPTMEWAGTDGADDWNTDWGKKSTGRTVKIEIIARPEFRELDYGFDFYFTE